MFLLLHILLADSIYLNIQTFKKHVVHCRMLFYFVYFFLEKIIHKIFLKRTGIGSFSKRTGTQV